MRLIITATAAVVAGLGGASLTAAINRMNTKDTLLTSRLVSETQLQHAGNREHKAWLRDQKQEAYMGFLREAQVLKQAASVGATSAPESTDPESLEVARNIIKLIGTPTVRRIAMGISQSVVHLHAAHRDLVRILNEISDRSTLDDALLRLDSELSDSLDQFYAARGEFARLLIEFIVEVRKDLGTATPEDAELDAENAALVITPAEVAAMSKAQKLESEDHDPALA